jgi:hypothetical protein
MWRAIWLPGAMLVALSAGARADVIDINLSDGSGVPGSAGSLPVPCDFCGFQPYSISEIYLVPAGSTVNFGELILGSYPVPNQPGGGPDITGGYLMAAFSYSFTGVEMTPETNTTLAGC